MPTIYKTLITVLLALSLAATGGNIGGLFGTLACVGAAIMASMAVLATAMDAFGEGYRQGLDEDKE